MAENSLQGDNKKFNRKITSSDRGPLMLYCFTTSGAPLDFWTWLIQLKSIEHGKMRILLSDLQVNAKLAQSGRHESRTQEVLGSILTEGNFFYWFVFASPTKIRVVFLTDIFFSEHYDQEEYWRWCDVYYGIGIDLFGCWSIS